MKAIAIVVLMLIVTACAPSETAIQTAIVETQSVWTPVPTQTPYPTYTAPPTVIKTIVVTRVITQTEPPEPIYTPTETPDPQTRSRGNGFYLVGVDIASGHWRSDGTSDDCYWALTGTTGDLMDNHFGMAGGAVYIPSSAFQVEFSDCGTWTYIGP